MGRVKVVAWTTFAAGIVCVLTSDLAGAQDDLSLQPRTSIPVSGTIKLRDEPIRLYARQTPLPEYPVAAIQRRQTGVAVATVSINEKNKVIRAVVLESPCAEIAAAVQDALMKWDFSAPQNQLKLPSGARTLSGKVIFYFFFQDGRYRVAAAKDAPNLNLHARLKPQR